MKESALRAQIVRTVVAGSILVPSIRSWYIYQHINALPGLTNMYVMYQSALQHVAEWIANAAFQLRFTLPKMKIRVG